jgi:hypothetical protein
VHSPSLLRLHLLLLLAVLKSRLGSWLVCSLVLSRIIASDRQ